MKYIIIISLLLPACALEEPTPSTGLRTSCIIQNEEGLTVALRESLHAAWDLPGGTVNVGETPEEALMREVMEETGLRVVQVEFILHAEGTNLYLCEVEDLSDISVGTNVLNGDAVYGVGLYQIQDLTPLRFSFMQEL